MSRSRLNDKNKSDEVLVPALKEFMILVRIELLFFFKSTSHWEMPLQGYSVKKVIFLGFCLRSTGIFREPPIFKKPCHANTTRPFWGAVGSMDIKLPVPQRLPRESACWLIPGLNGQPVSYAISTEAGMACCFWPLHRRWKETRAPPLSGALLLLPNEIDNPCHPQLTWMKDRIVKSTVAMQQLGPSLKFLIQKPLGRLLPYFRNYTSCNDFLKRTPKAQATKNIMKVKNFCSSKDSINRVKGQLTESDKVFAKHLRN